MQALKNKINAVQCVITKNNEGNLSLKEIVPILQFFTYQVQPKTHYNGQTVF